MSEASPSRRSVQEVVPRNGGARVKIVDSQEGGADAAVEGEGESSPGYNSGYEDGWQACLQEQEAKLTEVQQQLEAFANELPEALNAYLQELEKQAREEICDLSLRLSEVILRSEQLAPRAIQAAVEEALQDSLLQNETLTVEVSSHCADLLQAAEGQQPFPDQVQVVQNSALEDGDARLYCGEHLIDARLDRRLEKAREVIQNSMQNSGDHTNDSDQISPTEGDNNESGA